MKLTSFCSLGNLDQEPELQTSCSGYGWLMDGAFGAVPAFHLLMLLDSANTDRALGI